MLLHQHQALWATTHTKREQSLFLSVTNPNDNTTRYFSANQLPWFCSKYSNNWVMYIKRMRCLHRENTRSIHNTWNTTGYCGINAQQLIHTKPKSQQASNFNFGQNFKVLPRKIIPIEGSDFSFVWCSGYERSHVSPRRAHREKAEDVTSEATDHTTQEAVSAVRFWWHRGCRIGRGSSYPQEARRRRRRGMRQDVSPHCLLQRRVSGSVRADSVRDLRGWHWGTYRSWTHTKSFTSNWQSGELT